MPYRPFSNEDTRSSVLRAAQDASDQRAWGRFFDTYAGFVFGIARHRGLSEDDSHEIVQIVMSELVRSDALKTFDHAKGSFRHWLSQRAVWRIATFQGRLNSPNAEQTVDPDELTGLPAADGQFEFESEWRSAVTDLALDKLRAEVNPAHFEIYFASVFEGTDSAEICRRYKISPDNLYQIRRRLNQRFRILFENAESEFDDPDLR